MNRKDFLKSSLILSSGIPFMGCTSPKQAITIQNKRSTDIAHLLPTVNHNRLLLTASFKRPISNPRLTISQKSVHGTPRDSRGFFWIFDCDGLEANTTYDLQLFEDKESLNDSWQLKTFPKPTDNADHLRLLVYTCAGGHPLGRDLYQTAYKESREQFVKRRIALLHKGMSFSPDAVVAIGDQIYWDLDEILPGIPGEGNNKMAWSEAGKFDESLPILGTPNEAVLKKAIDPQIAELYGTICQSTPVFMLTDDHDHFENDNATPTKVTFPPDYFNLKLARVAQGMYWPEFLPDANRPIGLSAANAPDKAKHSSEIYGTLRYGKLAELLMYDCRRFTTLHGPAARFIAPDAEQWLMNRSADKDVIHTIHVPSLPIGWSAGKWMEWYPDKRNDDGNLSKDTDKYFWQQGWQEQHDRIIQHVSNQKNKTPVFLQGDLHTFAAGKIYRSGQLNLEKNPINACIVGPLGSTAFPSGIRGLKAATPTDIMMQEQFENVEDTGFSIVDITPDNIEINMYRFGNGHEYLIDSGPFQTMKIKRNS